MTTYDPTTDPTIDCVARRFPGNGGEIPSETEREQMNQWIGNDQNLTAEDRQPIPRTRNSDGRLDQMNNRAYFRSQLRRRFRRAGYDV
jgi:hypothetical protein